MAKEATKEGWKTIKEEVEKDWDKVDLDWNKRPLSDSEESNESNEIERKGERLNIEIISHQLFPISDEQMVTEDYIDDFEKNLSKGIMIMHNMYIIALLDLCLFRV